MRWLYCLISWRLLHAGMRVDLATISVLQRCVCRLVSLDGSHRPFISATSLRTKLAIQHTQLASERVGIEVGASKPSFPPRKGGSRVQHTLIVEYDAFSWRHLSLVDNVLVFNKVTKLSGILVPCLDKLRKGTIVRVVGEGCLERWRPINRFEDFVHVVSRIEKLFVSFQLENLACLVVML